MFDFPAERSIGAGGRRFHDWWCLTVICPMFMFRCLAFFYFFLRILEVLFFQRNIFMRLRLHETKEMWMWNVMSRCLPGWKDQLCRFVLSMDLRRFSVCDVCCAIRLCCGFCSSLLVIRRFFPSTPSCVSVCHLSLGSCFNRTVSFLHWHFNFSSVAFRFVIYEARMFCKLDFGSMSFRDVVWG